MTAPKAILWDIDGTMLRAWGAGVTCFTEALSTVTGLPFPTGALDMGGRTDSDIARRLLVAADVPGDHDEIADRLLAEVISVYTAREAEFAARTTVLDGVAEALTAFDGHPVVQTVVTGNVQPVARMKVTAADVHHHLRLDLGGFGSDHLIRSELVRTSCRRIADRVGPVAPEHTWIIGDTPRDLDSARAAGVRCILVATGTFAIDRLDGLGADDVLPDLTDLDRLLDLILG